MPIKKLKEFYEAFKSDVKTVTKTIKNRKKNYEEIVGKKKKKKQVYRGDLNFHPRPLTYSFILMNDTEVIALQAPIEYTMNDNAELQNGRWAMIGIMAALGAYATTGQIIPGIF